MRFYGLHLSSMWLKGSVDGDRSYAELFTTEAFSHMAFVDQSPLQNEALDWDKRFCNRGMNCERAVVELKEQLERDAEIVYGGTVAAYVYSC